MFTKTMQKLVLVSFLSLIISCSNSGNSEIEADMDGTPDGDLDAEDFIESETETEAFEACNVTPPEELQLKSCMTGLMGCVELKSWTCPEGWLAVTHESLTDMDGNPYQWCEPPESINCEGASAQFLGDSECSRIGTECPEAGFPDENAIREMAPAYDGNILYVTQDESLQEEFNAYASIGEAYSAASENGKDIIVVDRGIYDEKLLIEKEVALIGVCAEETIIHPAVVGDDEQIVGVSGNGGVLVKNIGITGDSYGMWIWSTGKPSVFEQLNIYDVQAGGILVSTAGTGGVTIRDTKIKGVRADSQGNFGRGIEVSGNGNSVAISRVLLEDSADMNLFIVDKVTATLSDVVSRWSESESSDWAGVGMWFQCGAQVTADRTLIEKSGNGLLLYDAGEDDVECSSNGYSSIISGNMVIRDALSNSARGYPGFGLTMMNGAHGSFTNLLLDGNSYVGIDIEAAPGVTTPELGEDEYHFDGKNVIVLNTMPHKTIKSLGVGVIANLKARIEGGLIENNAMYGFSCAYASGDCRLEDIVIRETQPAQVVPNYDDMADYFGFGLMASNGSKVTINRGLLESNRIIGMVSVTEGTELSASDVVVRDTLPALGGVVEGVNMAGRLGRGLSAELKGQMSINGGYVIGNRESAVTAVEGGLLQLTDVWIKDTLPSSGEATVDNPQVGLIDMNGEAGDGLAAARGGIVEGTRLLVEGSHEMGIAADGTDTVMTLTDLVVKDTHSCEGGMYVSGPLGENKSMAGNQGMGMMVRLEAHASITRGLFDNNKAIGLYAIFEGAVLELEDVEIRNTMERECADPEHPNYANCYLGEDAPSGAGIGLASFSGAIIKGDNVCIHDNHYYSGLRLSRWPGYVPEDLDIAGTDVAGTVEISDMRISNNLWGIHMIDLPEGYDFYSSNPGLWVYGNEVNVSTQKDDNFVLDFCGSASY